ncbi:hypothetical protein [Burkholderia sp. Ax-1719]|uniref:hypothetical protein n=1 Tax=Burkholderia sp. Ax-1719 TaxID=2608334 RepID=UPI00142414FB|nr:hypothetical protein [Burkholderia sp. Ax-1719]NIE66856.1 hypothetical protein [Burkholderia sp. Ax-1719]
MKERDPNARRLELQAEGRGAGAHSTFVHPGPATGLRVLKVESNAPSRDICITVGAEQNIGAVVNVALDRIGERGGCGRITSGGFSRVQYHVMTRATEGVKPYVYGAPRLVDGESTLVVSSINIGHLSDGARILHCHGGFVDSSGHQHGGHIILTESVAGATGLQIRLTLFAAVDFVAGPDDETTFNLLAPVQLS